MLQIHHPSILSRLLAGAVAALLVCLAGAVTAHAGAVIQDPGCAANVLPGNDDDVVGPIDMGFDIVFGGQPYSDLYIDNNGHVRLAATTARWWQLKDWASWGIPLISPFHADVDTRAFGSSQVTYGPITYGGRSAFCVNWVDVGYYSANDDKLNSFQLVLVDRGDAGLGDFDMLFNYDRMQWEAGDDSGSVDGVGGWFPPRVGYYDGTASVELPGSLTSLALLDSSATGLVHNSRNSLQLGRHVVPIRNGNLPAVVAGTVFDPSGFAVAGAAVQVCPAAGTCVAGITDSWGNYSLTGFDPADISNQSWRLQVFPPAGTDFLPPNQILFNFPPQPIVTDLDAVLQAPKGMPQDTSLEPSRSTGAGGTPIVYWKDPLLLSTQGCPRGTAQYRVLQNGAVVASGPMPETATGTYETTMAALYPLHGTIEIRIDLTCPDGSSGSYSFNAYIDPSGFVLDTRGEPVVGARMTLYRSDTPYGPFEPVPDGSAIMSPSNRANPSYTDERGHFGWDVMTGYYVVRAEKDGCTSPDDPARPYVETEVLPVPPEWLDLELFLDCEAITPPELTVPERVTATASGAQGAVVWYSASAFDGRDGPVPVHCQPSSGELFALGATQVTCNASDSHGNMAHASFEVSVTYAWSGVLAPLDPDQAVVRSGRVVPVKFALVGDSAGIGDAVAELFIALASGGSEVPAVGHANQGNRFRYDAANDLYIYNLSTRDLAPGRYRLRIDLGDGVPRTAMFTLGR